MQRGWSCGSAIVLAFLVGGGALVAMQVRGITRVAAARNWPTAPGRLLSARIVRESAGHGNSTYSLAVTYEYTVDGVTRRGRRLNASGSHYSTSWTGQWEALRDRLVRERPLRVRVNPGDAADTALTTDLESGDVGFLLLGLTATALPLALAFDSHVRDHEKRIAQGLEAADDRGELAGDRTLQGLERVGIREAGGALTVTLPRPRAARPLLLLSAALGASGFGAVFLGDTIRDIAPTLGDGALWVPAGIALAAAAWALVSPRGRAVYRFDTTSGCTWSTRRPVRGARGSVQQVRAAMVSRPGPGARTTTRAYVIEMHGSDAPPPIEWVWTALPQVVVQALARRIARITGAACEDGFAVAPEPGEKDAGTA